MTQPSDITTRRIVFLTRLALSQNGQWDKPDANWMNLQLPDELRYGNPHTINSFLERLDELGYVEQEVVGKRRHWVRITNDGRNWLVRQPVVDLPDSPPVSDPIPAGQTTNGVTSEPCLPEPLRVLPDSDRPQLSLNDEAALPIEYVVKKTGIFGQSGSGKSNTAAVIMSELLRHGCRTAVIDPQGDWWGLRSSFNGQEPGFSIIIMGGEHGDLDLGPNDAHVAIRLLKEFNHPVILDTSHMSKKDQASFLADFVDLVYWEEWRTSPIHIFFDEADQVISQPNSKGITSDEHEELSRLRNAMTDIAKRGRKRGIGFTLISQRPVNLYTEVLMLIDMMVILRLMGSRDVEAINGWVKHQQTASGAGKQIISSLPELPSGTAWFWAPSWLGAAKVPVRRRTTFDSGATPEWGKEIVEPEVFAEVDQAILEAVTPPAPERTDAPDAAADDDLDTELAGDELVEIAVRIDPEGRVHRLTAVELEAAGLRQAAASELPEGGLQDVLAGC